VVDVDDLIAVSLNWGDCPGGFNLGAPRSIPQSLQNCMDKCDEKFPDDPDKWADCVDACYEAAD
jgi:hypothetical protein